MAQDSANHVYHIYRLMERPIPFLLERAIDLPHSIMHSPFLAPPRHEVMSPDGAQQRQGALMLTTATGQPLSPNSSRPAIAMANEDPEVMSFQGHAMDPTDVERGYREAQTEALQDKLAAASDDVLDDTMDL
jgi:hypothetical protein